MIVFLYEFITGGGCWSTPDGAAPGGSLLREGAAMFDSLADDFARCGVTIVGCRDARLVDRLPPRPGLRRVANAAEECAAFEDLARAADATIVVAPELDGALCDRVDRAERHARALWSPGADFVRIAADKQATAERLAAAGVPVPRGVRLAPGAPPPRDFAYPAVLKPVDGAGSLGVRRMEGPDDDEAGEPRGTATTWRLETWHAGIAASIAAIVGPSTRILLPALSQRLGGATGFEYQGGAGPLAAPLRRRAERLAAAALDALPPTVGYVGFDLILGDASDGGDDVVIEINPRLTTSYVGLRELCESNLADVWRRAAAGTAADLSIRPGSVEFAADGRIVRRPEDSSKSERT